MLEPRSHHRLPLTIDLRRRPLWAAVLLGLGLALLLTGAGVRVGDGNLMLAAAAPRGDLLVLSGNINVTEGARLDGGLYVLCCNVLVDGEVRGDVQLLSGNLRLGPTARVAGAVGLGTGNLSQDSAARTGGAGGGIGPGFWWALARAFFLAPALLLAGGLLLVRGRRR